MYGYIFEHEATYDRMCLVNNAVYIAKYKDGKHAGEWTATGTQFQIPYVFKKLFSHEEITFEDMCETKSVTSAIYIDRSPDEAAAYINNPDMAIQSEDNLVLDNGHTLQFIGKVGLFSPIKSGCGGGSLVRQNTDKNGNVKGYAFHPEVMLPPNAKGKLDVGGALGVGVLSVIQDIGLKEPYVGQTELKTGEIGDDLTLSLIHISEPTRH